LKDDFTIANGEVTLSMKLKRRVVEQRYKDVIDSIYADVEEPGPQDLASI
jgi:long-chain acyl-CoA synthetase